MRSSPQPHPEVFLRCAELLGVAPSRCAVIEDSVNGVLAARAAGMSPIGFPTHSGASLHLYEVLRHRLQPGGGGRRLKLIQPSGPLYAIGARLKRIGRGVIG